MFCIVALAFGLATTVFVAAAGTCLIQRMPFIHEVSTRDISVRRTRSFAWRSTTCVTAEPASTSRGSHEAMSRWREIDLMAFSRGYSPSIDPGVPSQVWNLYEAGWPFIAFRGWHVREFGGPAGMVVHQQGLIDLPVLRRAGRSSRTAPFPFWPRWTGLLSNSAIYGMGWAALFLFAHRWRVTKRRKRGCCICCGYDLRGAVHGCPECGWNRQVEGATEAR